MDRSMPNSPFRSELSSWQSPADVRAAVHDALRRGDAAIVVTSGPASGKTALAREYQDAFRRANPAREFSYGSLEGYATAKALVAALTLAGADLSRAGLVKALQKADIELGGMVARYRPGDHAGSSFVDLALVTREGKFLQ
jgi:ABC-type branched-subunit amino acid transport system substrate-binding protein